MWFEQKLPLPPLGDAGAALADASDAAAQALAAQRDAVLGRCRRRTQRRTPPRCALLRDGADRLSPALVAALLGARAAADGVGRRP